MTTAKKSPERELAEIAAVLVAKQERKSAKALLVSEAGLVRKLRSSIKATNSTLVASAASGASAATLSSQVRVGLPQLQQQLHRDFAAGFSVARDGAVAVVDSPRIVVPVAVAEDDAAAALSAASLASSWAGAAMQVITTADGKRGILGELAAVPSSVENRIQVNAITQTARAFNDERELMIAVGSPYRSIQGQGDTGPRRAKAYKIWSAILDGRTCSRCFALDGQIVEADKPFKSAPPPLHPRCRCLVEHIIVSKPERLEDIEIDYDLFKQEVRDVIREGRAESMRHAQAFAAESLGPKRSPITLTNRFRKKPYER